MFQIIFRAVTDFFLIGILNYTPPVPGGEGTTIISNLSEIRWWLLPFVVGLGGLLSGLVVFTIAPEAEGHGTDSVIDSFHHKGGRIRSRVPIVKIIASSITIGTGGSAGREGPIAQIGAGFGSWLATRLKLGDSDRRILVTCGAAAGIGAIFKAPLGASLFAIEVLYKRDMEVESLIPAFISSVVSYSVYSSINGFNPIFSSVEYQFRNPAELLFFIILGVSCAFASILYTNIFYELKDRFFDRIPGPKFLKPALGGFIMGLIAIKIPETLEMGYGWVQLAMYGQLAIGLMLIIAFAKMITTSLSIGSGGSGGVFAPSLMIGGLIGGVLGAVFNSLAPTIVVQPAAFILVGMAAFFAGAAKVPIAAMIMVAEMTYNYNFLIPAMVTCSISYALSGPWTLYRNQVETRLNSPAHLGDYSIDLLEEVKVRDIMAKRMLTVEPTTTADEVSKLIAKYKHLSYPVIDNGVLVGIVTYKEIVSVPFEKMRSTRVGDVMGAVKGVISPDKTAADALKELHITNQEQLVVMDPRRPGIPVGIVTHSDIIHSHESAKLGFTHKKIAGALDHVLVEEVMRRDVVTVDIDDDLNKLNSVMALHRYHGYPVIEDGRLVGVVTLDNFIENLRKGNMSVKAGEMMERNFEVIHPDETMSNALKKMFTSKQGRLLVVMPDKPWRVIGIVTKSDIIRAWELEEPFDFS
jgi:chloride channel protein, CIC family